MAMENPPLIVDFPMNSSIFLGIPGDFPGLARLPSPAGGLPADLGFSRPATGAAKLAAGLGTTSGCLDGQGHGALGGCHRPG